MNEFPPPHQKKKRKGRRRKGKKKVKKKEKNRKVPYTTYSFIYMKLQWEKPYQQLLGGETLVKKGRIKAN